ncbi:MAG TPA: hypothetical protein VH762_16340 [Gemmatimonadaceae bacterium]|jgi:hypothetical protein
MRARVIIATLSFVATAPLAAQAVRPNTPRLLPSPTLDTVIVSAFALANGAFYANPGTPLTMDHKVLGKQPTHFRASKFADFHDVNWTTYPSSVPVYTGNSTGACGTNHIKMVVHLQVRAVKVFSPETGKTTFVLSNVARDTTCIPISG